MHGLRQLAIRKREKAEERRTRALEGLAAADKRQREADDRRHREHKDAEERWHRTNEEIEEHRRRALESLAQAESDDREAEHLHAILTQVCAAWEIREADGGLITLVLCVLMYSRCHTNASSCRRGLRSWSRSCRLPSFNLRYDWVDKADRLSYCA